MLHAARDDEHVTGAHVDRPVVDLDPEAALPTHEQLVVAVVVPRRLAFDHADAHDRVVHGHDVLGLEWPFDGRGEHRDRHGSFHRQPPIDCGRSIICDPMVALTTYTFFKFL